MACKVRQPQGLSPASRDQHSGPPGLAGTFWRMPPPALPTTDALSGRATPHWLHCVRQPKLRRAWRQGGRGEVRQWAQIEFGSCMHTQAACRAGWRAQVTSCRPPPGGKGAVQASVHGRRAAAVAEQQHGISQQTSHSCLAHLRLPQEAQFQSPGLACTLGCAPLPPPPMPPPPP